MLFEEDKQLVESAIDQRFFGNRQGCGLKNLEVNGWRSLEGLLKNLTTMNGSLMLKDNMGIQAQTSVIEAL